MKIEIDIDCTPAEARVFLGLPDVGSLQQALLEQIQERMTASLAGMDPETLFKAWLPAGLQGWEQMQKAFWKNVPGTSGGKAGGQT